jgi:hypothetical protein
MTLEQWSELLGAVLATAAAVYLLGWTSSSAWHDKQATRRQRAADARTAAARGHLASTALLADRPAPLPTYAGWVEGTRWADWQGAQDRQYLAVESATMPIPATMGDVMDMVAAGYQLGQDRAAADQAHAEAEAIWAEVEAHPETWRHQ